MKKLIIIALALVTVQITAQERKNRQNKERGNRGERMERFQDYTPEEMATLQTKKMTLHLDLTKSQQKEIQKLNLENAIDRKAKMDARKSQNEGDKFQKPSKDERLKMMNERLDNQIEMKNKMKNILNEDQFAKWEQMQQDMKNKNMAKNKGQKKGQNKGQKR